MSAEAGTTAKENRSEKFARIVKEDYRLAVESREASLIGRREVLTGKAKFGIFGDGKEVAQIAWAKFFKEGDFRSGYYRDQTFMMAIGELNTRQFFASLYADTNHEHEPASAGRQMNGHFATQSLDENGHWKNLSAQKNSSADVSPTAAQMPRLLGLAEASKKYREIEALHDREEFSRQGNEIAWGTIGNASTAEGIFYETFNAAGVLQVPMVISVWDDEYGISVHSKYQTTKEDISTVLQGFQREDGTNGYEIIRVKGWDYPALIQAYEKAEKIAREEHIPVLLHVDEITQPQGHSTSGSHERYKSKERLEWEKEHDCLHKMRQWMMASEIATEEELDELEKAGKKAAREAKTAAWKDFITPIKEEISEVQKLIQNLAEAADQGEALKKVASELESAMDPLRREVMVAARKAVWLTRGQDGEARQNLRAWLQKKQSENRKRYSSHLVSESEDSPLRIDAVTPQYADDAREVDGRIILRDNFDRLLAERPEVLVFGEDSGKIGDVNQGLEGLQGKHGEARVYDTGIREATILGQGIGMAMRGLRPIAEIQYLDYLYYALQIMTDDLATLHYRTRGRQKAPLIVRTRGHRLEGIWHSGSPMGAIIHSLRGVHILVPRDMTRAAGFYNTLLEGDDPALLIECLNGYRLKERVPENLAELRVPLGEVETLREGKDITLVTYGSCCRIAQSAAEELAALNISVEIIDIQSLLPFDRAQNIAQSLQKTNRLVVLDEDVPGGASAYILQQVLEEQQAWRYLDSAPTTITAQAHRPAYGSDGDYFSKPSTEDVVERVYSLMYEFDPQRYPAL